MAAFSTGTRRVSGPREHEAAHVLAQVARKADQHAAPGASQRCTRGSSGSSPLAQRCGQFLAPSHQCQVAGPARRSPPGNAQRAAHVAQRAAGAVADHHGGQRGALAAVLGVDVLDHLLAPLVLEVDVDVGRLVALAAR
jgi:hypothetical protein